MYYYRSLWATMKISDDKVTHHSYQKLASELNGEVRFTPQGVYKVWTAMDRVRAAGSVILCIGK